MSVGRGQMAIPDRGNSIAEQQVIAVMVHVWE